MASNLKIGDLVQYNLGRPDGPVFQGRVTRMLREGQPLIMPLRSTQMTNVQFYNIKKVDETK